MNKILLIADGHNLLFKAFGVPFKFNSASGTPLHVVSTYLSMLRRAVKAVQADELVLVFDSQFKTSNHELLPTYKANRSYEYVEDSPFDHLPFIKDALDTVEIAWFEEAGLEADDIIGSFAKMHNSKSTTHQSFILSTDTDFLQLLNDQTKILQLKTGNNHQILDPAHVVEIYGVSPERFVELKSWVGDKADNIPGIAGIGWVRATKVLNGELVRELSPEEEELLKLNRKLIELSCDLELEQRDSPVTQLLKTSNPEIFGQCGF